MGFGVQKFIVVAAQPLLELLDLRRGVLVQLLLLRILKDIVAVISRRDIASFTQLLNDALSPTCPFIDPIIHPCARIQGIAHVIQAHYLNQTP